MKLSSIAEQWLQVPPYALAALNLSAAVLLIAIALAWGRHRGRRLLVASAFMTVAVITVIYVSLVRPSDIPIDWITVLTRGFERKSIMHLYANGAHAGPNFDFVLSVISAGAVPNLHDVVWLNLLLALINAALFLHVAVSIASPVWAVVWTIVFALNPATFLASFSELPSSLLALYFLTGLLAWTMLHDSAERSPLIRGAAVIFCCVLTALAALTRLEVSLIGLIALALYAGPVLFGADARSALWQRPRRLGERALAFLSAHPGVVVVLGLLAWQGPWMMAREEIGGLYPFNAAILGLFVFIPMLGLPIGAAIATFCGFVRGIFNFRRFGGLPLSLAVIISVYFDVYDSYYEMARFLSYVLPAVFCLGLFGTEQFHAMIRGWGPNWQRAARIVYVLSWLTLPLPGVFEFYLRSEYGEYTTLRAGVSQLLLDRNTQREVRHLLALTERNPQCVFVGRVIRDQGDFRRHPQYEYAVFGGPIAYPIFVAEKEIALDEVISSHAAGASCVRLHYGSDCNVRLGDRCTQFIGGRRLVEEERFWSRPYNSNPWDNGAPEIILATYAWP